MTTTATTIEAPTGLTITPAAPNPVGIAYRGHCQAHDYCRTHLLVFTADSWEDLHLRTFPAFLRHCEDMDRWS